jgi:hypothetical protein
MADIIDLSSRFKPGHNLIAMSPLEFRKGQWLSGSAILCTREESAKLEAQRRKATPDRPPITLVPNHITLDGGYHYTSLWLFRFREDETRMRRLYRLAGLMECVTKAPSPVLRTDLVRRFFKIINAEREQLNVSWKGNVRNFLLPLHAEHYNPGVFIDTISGAPSLKDLLAGIERETDSQFDILANSYVFYVPETFLSR